MALSSKAKKEEADLRAIAKKARLAKKEAAARERKAKERARRQQLKGEPQATAATPAAPAKRRAKGAIILPHEVAEVRQRFGADALAGAPSGAPPPKPSGRKGSKAAKAAAEASAGTAVATPPAVDAAAKVIEPPYSMEVHHKRQQVLLNVTLHRVPPQLISVEKTTEDTFRLDTLKFTKKFVLNVPFPSGLRVDVRKAEYEVDQGILRCVLPIKGGVIPEELVAARETMIEEMKQQRALRFRTTQDGDLVVRTRRALLAKDETHQAALFDAIKQVQAGGVKRGRSVDEEGEGGSGDTGVANAATLVTKSAPTTSSSVKAGSAEKPQRAAAAKKSRAEAPVPAEAEKPATGKKKGKVLLEDNQSMLQYAKAAGQAVRVALREKMAQAKQIHAQRMERLQRRTERRKTRDEKVQASYARIVGELKESVESAKALLAPPTPRGGGSAAAAATAIARPAKRVRFASS